MPNLVLLAGVPGCGKSQWAETFFQWKYAIVSSDRIRERLAGSLRAAHEGGIRPWDVFYEEIEDRLCHFVDVIADATFLTRRHRDRAREVAARQGANVHLVIFKNVQTAGFRNARRDEDVRVPSEAFSDMMSLYWNMLDEISTEQYTSVTRIQEYD